MMTKLCAWSVTCLLVVAGMPASAQRGHIGGHASMSSGMSGMGGIRMAPMMSPSTIESHSAVRANTRVKTKGLERAETAQSLNTKANAHRGFTVARGVERAESKQSKHEAKLARRKAKHARHQARRAARANATAKTTGLERAETVQSINTRADARRGFTSAPGVENAEAVHSRRASARANMNASSNTNMTITPGSASARSHTSFGARVLTKLHLKKRG